MIIEEVFRVNAPKSEVASFLVDAERMSSCVPGVESLEEVAEGEFRATLRARLGPMAAAFQGTLRLDDSEAPDRLTARGEGRDQRSGSQANVEFVADLEEDGSETVVRTQADVVIRGKLGQFGTGVINSTAQEMIREFAQCVNGTLSVSAETAGPGGEGRPRASLFRIGSRGVVAWLVGIFRSVWIRVRGLFDSRGGS